MSVSAADSNCCSRAFDISNRYHDMVNYDLKDKYCVKFYREHPIAARGVFMTIALIRGLVKPLFFLLEALVAAIYLPLKGAYLGLKEREGTVDYIKAGALNLLGVVSVGAFFVVAAYYLPLAASASIYMAATVFCIVVHIKRAAEDPPEFDGGSGPGAGIDGTPPGGARSGRGSGDDSNRLDGDGGVVHTGTDLDPAAMYPPGHLLAMDNGRSVFSPAASGRGASAYGSVAYGSSITPSERARTLPHASGMPGGLTHPYGSPADAGATSLLDHLVTSPAVMTSTGFTPAPSTRASVEQPAQPTPRASALLEALTTTAGNGRGPAPSDVQAGSL